MPTLKRFFCVRLLLRYVCVNLLKPIKTCNCIQIFSVHCDAFVLHYTYLYTRLYISILDYIYLYTRRTHKGLKYNDVNQAFTSLHKGSLEIILTL